MENDKARKMEYKFDQWLNENNDVVEIDGEHYEPAIVLLRTDKEKYLTLFVKFLENLDEDGWE